LTAERAPFAERLRRLREDAGLTQEELASRAGLTAKAVSALERGERKRPYPHTVRSLADALGLAEEERASLLASVPRRGAEELVSDEGSNAAVAATPAAPLTPLVGREREVEEIGDLLRREEVRLLTLTGAGGIGKTRLAVEVAREAPGGFPDGVAFVALAPLSDAALVVPTISQTLGLKEAARLSSLEALRDHLREKRMLLVLDNLEHVLGAAPEVAGLIESSPNLTVLVTSRAPLLVRGEHGYPIPPLALPTSTLAPAAEEVLASPSGRLFVERARAASPQFELTEKNAAAVAAICWRLDGLPLALELAAARTKFMDPASLLGRLDKALSTGWARDLPERQRTMRATLDWSHDLLGQEEKVLFRRLAVFTGGFELEAAEALGVEDALNLLGRLVEQSLVLAEASSGEMRYRMLEPVRQYALDKLEESGEAGEVRRRHAAYYLALAERVRPKLQGRDEGEWLDRLEAENDNLRAATGRSLEAGDAETALRLVAELWWFWHRRGYVGEGRRWLEEALGRGTSPISARAEALNGAGVMARIQADYVQAQEWLEESLELRRELGDKKGAAEVLINLGTVAFDRGDYPRTAALETESLSLMREVGDTWGIAIALNNLGLTLRVRGELAEAASLFEESLELFRALEDRAGIATVLSNLGAVAERTGEYEKAAAFYQGSLDLYREVGEKRGIALLTDRLAGIARIRADYERAAALYNESLRLHRELGDRRGISQDLEGIAAMLAALGQPERAVRLWAAVEALRERIGVPPSDTERARYEPLAATAREALGERAWTEAHDEGRTMTFDEAVAYALEQGSGASPVTRTS
jgi:predicted ATPase/DNA-binding XRE family transcriptional regulator